MRQQNAEWLKKKKKKIKQLLCILFKANTDQIQIPQQKLEEHQRQQSSQEQRILLTCSFFSWNIEYELLNNQSCLQHGYTFPHMNNSTVPPTSKACLEKHRKQKSARIKKRNWGKVQGARRGDKEVNQGKKKTLIQGMFFSISLFVCSTRQEPHMCSTASHHQENHNKKTISFRYVCTHKNEL